MSPYVPKELRHTARARIAETRVSANKASSVKPSNSLVHQNDARQFGSIVPAESRLSGSSAQQATVLLTGNREPADKSPPRQVANVSQTGNAATANSSQPGSLATAVDKSQSGQVADLSQLGKSEPVDLSLLSQFAEGKGLNPAKQQLPTELPELFEQPPKLPEGPSIVEDSPTKRRKADYRNDARWTQMDAADADLIGKLGSHYLSRDPNSFTPDPILGPDDSFDPPD
jgi:hypothetical protein